MLSYRRRELTGEGSAPYQQIHGNPISSPRQPRSRGFFYAAPAEASGPVAIASELPRYGAAFRTFFRMTPKATETELADSYAF
jgi:hypothetical protein